MTNTILYRKNRIFFFLLFFFILLFITLYSCTNQKNDKITYYYSGDKKIEVRVVQDTLGILLYRNRSGLIKADSINSFANKLGANYVKSLSENIILVTKQGTGDKTITQASQSATSLKQKNPGVVSKAGYLIYQKTSKVPLIVTDELIIKFKNGTGQQEITKFLNKHKLKIISQSPNSKNEYLVSIADNKKLNTLKASEVFNKNKLVDYSEPNFVMVTDYRGFDPMVSPWHHNNTGISPGGGNPGGVEDADLDTDLAWSFTKGNNVKIAVIDVGFDMMHHELTPNFDINTVEIPNNGIDDPPQNGYVDDDIGWDFNDCIDENNPGCGTNILYRANHGTMVAGSAAAKGNNTIGIAGTCPDCKIIPLSIGATPYSRKLAFEYAVARGARIINCSWGYPEGTEIPLMVKNAIIAAHDAGIIIFFAAPNENIDASNLITPDISSLPQVIAVGRSTDLDRFDFSAIGDSMDLLAPSGSDNSYGNLFISTIDESGIEGDNRGEGEFCRGYDVRIDPDYTVCGKGTSVSTPLVAGIAGLILSVAPSLTPEQVQRLLQDCADKIDTGEASYSPFNGFSTHPGRVATHGYGRVNAYEAVKIASPDLAKKGRNGVDIFIRDNYLDWGNTEKPSNYVFNSVRDFIPHWKSPDIKIDAPDNINQFETPVNNREFETFQDERPIGSKTNKVYVRIRNRGFRTAGNVDVKLYWVYGGTALPALWTGFPADVTGDPNWNFLGSQTISTLPYSGSSIAGKENDPAQIVSFNFDAPVPNPDLPNHYCLLAMISCTDDPLVSNGSSNLDLVTPYFNNITHKNFGIETINSPALRVLFLYNPYNKPMQTKVSFINPQQIHVQTDSIQLDTLFYMAPFEKRLIKFYITNTDITYPSEITIIQEMILEDVKKQKIKGGFTYYFKN